MATRPCWHCATQHESDTIPALCSDSCRDAWRKCYELQFGEPPYNLQGLTVAGVTAGLEALKAAVRAERQRAVLADEPISVLHDPAWWVADQPQDLVNDIRNADTCPPRPPEPPEVHRPLADPRSAVRAYSPWWRRLFSGSS